MKVHSTQNGWCHACGGVGDPDVAEHVNAMMSPAAQRLVGPGVVGSTEWRAEHCRLGDAALTAAESTLNLLTEGGGLPSVTASITLLNLQVLTAIAQAHYAAANVRYRP